LQAKISDLPVFIQTRLWNMNNYSTSVNTIGLFFFPNILRKSRKNIIDIMAP
jgi:hypothetical protein